MHERARQLLSQLVNAPESLSRNRHFSLFEEPRARDVRRRASYLRTIRGALLEGDARLERVKHQDERMMLRLVYTTGAVQRIWLDSAEASILKSSLLSEASGALRGQFERIFTSGI